MVWWISYSFYFIHSVFKGGSSTSVSLLKKYFKHWMDADVYRAVSFKLGRMIETTKLYIFISVCMTLTFIQDHNYMRNKKFWCFLEISWLIWRKFSMLPQPVSLLKLMLNLFCTSSIEGREICRCDFIKCVQHCPVSGRLWTGLFQTWLHKATTMFMIVDYVIGRWLKKSGKHDEY